MRLIVAAWGVEFGPIPSLGVEFGPRYPSFKRAECALFDSMLSMDDGLMVGDVGI